MSRVYNFSAGPSMLPLSVLEKAKSELLEYGSTGQSVMEMSHRSKEYLAIFDECEEKFRAMLGVPETHSVLFLQGGAWTQFAMIPMNLMTINKKADFVLSGNWAEKACSEAKKFGTANVVASSKEDNFAYIPAIDKSKLDPDADYMHICYNNTIYGTEFQAVPESVVPLVADVSSMILSQPMDVSKFGAIYGGAQKNMGPAGLVVVVMRNDLIERSPDSIPSMLNYKIQRDNQSMFNTPPTYAIYVLSLMLDWLKNDIGGLEKMLEINKQKAAVLYDYLDESKLFKGTVRKDSRSLMNICFVTGDKDLDNEFCSLAAKEGMPNLKGHRLVGGVRASIYNAMPMEGVVKLRDFMREFEKEHI